MRRKPSSYEHPVFHADPRNCVEQKLVKMEVCGCPQGPIGPIRIQNGLGTWRAGRKAGYHFAYERRTTDESVATRPLRI